MRHTLGIHVYAPALEDGESRPLAIVQGLERAFPGLSLGWTVSEDKQLVPLPQRDAWLVQARRKGGFPFVCNNDERYPIMLSGWETPARLGPGRHALLDVYAQLPMDAAVIAAAPDLLEAVSEGAGAFWGHATPFEASGEIAQQTIHSHGQEVPPRGLPPLKLPEALGAPEIPHRLGWLNYWSAVAARAIGFPAPARDADLLARARHTTSGGWLVPLTETPLELNHPAHLEALLRAYERFPRIGGRAMP